jgi:hypothetical protein
MTLGEFRLERAVFEVRYPTALWMWDRAGVMWNVVGEKWADVKLIEASPGKTVFRLESNYELVVELNQLRVIAHWPDWSLGRLPELSAGLLDVATRYMELKVLSRVGFRVWLFRKFPDRKGAAEALLGSGLVQLPQGQKFAVEGRPISLESTIRWEGAAKGVTLRLACQTRQFNLEAPPDVDPELMKDKPQRIEFQGVLYDVDFFTTSPVQVGQLLVPEYLREHMHALKRDGDSFLGG